MSNSRFSREYSDAYKVLNEYYKRLKHASRIERRKMYVDSDFLKKLDSIAQALKSVGISRQDIETIVLFGTEIRAKTQNMSDHFLKFLASMDKSDLETDVDDTFFMSLENTIHQLNEQMNKAVGDDIMQKIDAQFAESIQSLTESIPEDLGTSKKYLLDAVESFRKGSKEEAAVRTRKAWESCVTFALTKLPEKEKLNSLEKKSIYVFEQLGMKDESKLVARIKGLYEGRFLHALETNEEIQEPELPFYIALTAGFVHLVASALA